MFPDRTDRAGRHQAWLEAARWNTEQGHGWTYLGGGTVRGLMSVSQPLSPSSPTYFFSAAFPYVNLGKESGGDIRPYLLFDTAQLAQVIGNNYSYVVDAERFQHDPSQFAATLSAISLPHVEIEWVYYHQPEYTGPELVSGFGFQFAPGPPQTELDYSNSLAFTQEQAYEFSQGGVVSLMSQHELKMDPIVVYCGEWRAVAYICQSTAWNNGEFRYVVAVHPM